MTRARAELLNRRAGLINPPYSSGQSDSAKHLVRLSEEARRHLLASVTVRRPAEDALNELDNVYAEASQRGWNGYDAKPVDYASYRQAKAFLEALPTTSPFPEISAYGDGEISLDWHFGWRKALTISVGGNGRLTFAWIDGYRSLRGTDWLNEDGIPATIADAISKLGHPISSDERIA